MAGWQAPIFENPMVLQAYHDLKAVLDPVGHRLRDTRYRPALGIYYPMTAHIQGGHVAFVGPMDVKRGE